MTGRYKRSSPSLNSAPKRNISTSLSYSYNLYLNCGTNCNSRWIVTSGLKNLWKVKVEEKKKEKKEQPDAVILFINNNKFSVLF